MHTKKFMVPKWDFFLNFKLLNTGTSVGGFTLRLYLVYL
jgi:hypothetical protein